MEKILKPIWFALCLGAFACCVYLVFRPASVLIVSDGKAVQTTQKFGGTTGLDSLALVGNLSVGGTATLTGALTVSSLDETLSSGNVVPARAIRATMSSSATTTACTILNTSGATKVITGIGVIDRGSAVSTGAVVWTAGTSTYNGANGSSAATYTKFVNTIATRVSGVDTLTTTSTVLGSSGVYGTWENNVALNFVSGSTTNLGSCWVTTN